MKQITSGSIGSIPIEEMQFNSRRVVNKFMRILAMVMMILMTSSSLLAQQRMPTSKELGFEEFRFSTAALGEVRYYVRHDGKDRRKPLLVYLDGSGPIPLFQYSDGQIGSTVPIQGREFAEAFNILLISKPGVPFIDKMEMTPNQMPDYPAPPEYEKRLSLDWRVNSARGSLDDLLQKQGFEPSEIAILGISEGFQVGARLAALDPRIQYVGLFVGNGLNQFYDFILEARQKQERGELTAEQAQAEIDSILKAAEDIYANPKSTDKHWMGHTYLRWSSFCKVHPCAELIKVKAPIFIAVCSQDRNSTVLSADFIPLEFLRQGKKNLTFKTYPYDHSFSQLQKDSQGNVVGAESHLMEVLDEWLQWYKEQTKRSSGK